VDVESLRPRARTVLRMLAVDVGAGVHRETLCEQLWPADDQATAAKKLQVAISSIRRLLDGAGDLVRRRGEVYVLDVGPEVSDVQRVSAAVVAGRTALARGDAEAAGESFRAALDVPRGELLPEEGAADWVIGRRQAVVSDVIEAATGLAEILLDRGDPGEAVKVCRNGLAADRYCDPLWRLLLQALDAAHDTAGHARARHQYDAVLTDLGITPLPGG
jgi:DNA-binding SARP family transcriptional activator